MTRRLTRPVRRPDSEAEAPFKLYDVMTPYIKTMSTFLYLEPRDIPAMEFVPIVVLGIQLDRGQEGIWGYLCGAAASAKSDTINAFDGTPWAHFTDDATVASLLSGYDRDGDRSKAKKAGRKDWKQGLLYNVDGKALVIHDLSPVLSRVDNAAALYGALRSAYSGKFRKAVGNDLDQMEILSKFGFLAGVTEGALDRVLTVHQRAGERFVALRCSNWQYTRARTHKMAKQIYRDTGTGTESRSNVKKRAYQRIRLLFEQGIAQIQLGRVTSSQLHRDLLADLAHSIAKLRSQPDEGRPQPAEGPPRILQVLSDVCHIRARLYGRESWVDSDLAFVARLGRDSMPNLCRYLLNRVISYRPGRSYAPGAPPGIPMKKLCDSLKIPAGVLVPQLLQWEVSGIAKHLPVGGALAADDTCWHFTSEEVAAYHRTGMVTGGRLPGT